MSVEALCIGLMIFRLVEKITDFGIGVSIEACMLILELVEPALYNMDFLTAVMVDMLATTAIGVAPDIGVDVLNDVGENMWGVTMAASESISILASSEKSLCFTREACSC